MCSPEVLQLCCARSPVRTVLVRVAVAGACSAGRARSRRWPARWPPLAVRSMVVTRLVGLRLDAALSRTCETER